MPAPATHDFVHLEISSASVLNTSVNGPLNYLIGRNLGSDDAIELEDSLEILSGSGSRYLRLPQGTTGQRPTGAAGLLRLNTTLGSLDYHDGAGWEQPLTQEAVSFGNLNANGDVGTAGAQLAEGDHGHNVSAFVDFLQIGAERGHSNNTFFGPELITAFLTPGAYRLIAVVSVTTLSNATISGDIALHNTTPNPDLLIYSQSITVGQGVDGYLSTVVFQQDVTIDGTERYSLAWTRTAFFGVSEIDLAVMLVDITTQITTT